jgi:hypothetical protein
VDHALFSRVEKIHFSPAVNFHHIITSLHLVSAVGNRQKECRILLPSTFSLLSFPNHISVEDEWWIADNNRANPKSWQQEYSPFSHITSTLHIFCPDQCSTIRAF